MSRTRIARLRRVVEPYARRAAARAGYVVFDRELHPDLSVVSEAYASRDRFAQVFCTELDWQVRRIIAALDLEDLTSAERQGIETFNNYWRFVRASAAAQARRRSQAHPSDYETAGI